METGEREKMERGPTTSAPIKESVVIKRASRSNILQETKCFCGDNKDVLRNVRSTRISDGLKSRTAKFKEDRLHLENNLDFS